MEKRLSGEVFYPSDEVRRHAHIQDYSSLYQRSIENYPQFWAECSETLEWQKPWKEIVDASQKPFYRWFTEGQINIAANAIDRHLKTSKKDKIAFLWEGEDGEQRSFTYLELSKAVSRIANGLKAQGIKKGDTVTLYLPLIPELPMTMLACAKIGAIHSVIYGGFSVEALAARIEDAKSRVLVTADGGFRRGKITDLKRIVNQAADRSPTLERCIVVKRTGHEVEMKPGRDLWLHELCAEVPDSCETERMDSEDPLFILYTSGTTGKPKGLVHTHGGYAVYTSTTHQMVFDIQEQDRYWCTADPGWITGHSYVVYGPLINGASVFLYEGAPNHPHPDRYWDMIDRHQITILYTSPTAIRGLMRFGDEWPKKHRLNSLRLLGTVGEPINPEAWKWYYKTIGHERCPIMDTWWQTETGGFVITPLPITPLKPGSGTKPFFGHEVAVVDEMGKELPPGQEGLLVLKNPWPGMARTIWGDSDRYRDVYWSTFQKQGWYKTGDSARIDEDGYIWVIGRVDEVIKVSGYRLGTAEIESALVSHPSVAEAAAIGLPHEIKGNSIHAFVLLRAGKASGSALITALKEHVVKEIGPIARPEEIYFMEALPKTRSGKIMRRVLKSRALGQDVGDISTLEE